MPPEALADRLANGLATFRRDLGARTATTTVVAMIEFGRWVEENSALVTGHGSRAVMSVLGGGRENCQLRGLLGT
jgi:uncharacterized protein (DUF1501 family)